jgi:hypothetical protein
MLRAWCGPAPVPLAFAPYVMLTPALLVRQCHKELLEKSIVSILKGQRVSLMMHWI